LETLLQDGNVPFSSTYWLRHFLDSQRTLEKQQAATCCFSKEFYENSGNLPTNRKNSACIPYLQGFLQMQKQLVLSGSELIIKIIQDNILKNLKNNK
jgi:hypothetical protein